MSYANLKENKCPQCGKFLDWDTDGKLFCKTVKCGFSITAKGIAEIVAQQVNTEIDERLDPVRY